MLKYFKNLSNKIKLVLPLHPRTKSNIEKFWLSNYLENENIIISEPLAYTDFINLLMNSKFILTDSWWAQEESTFLQIPCLTMRENTERPITCEIWTSELIWNDFSKIDFFINQIITWTYKKWKIPDLWDWKASNRILNILLENK
jgi:UDP-N-acetylglucosamine 2-epimerase (non-hydrolysing)